MTLTTQSALDEAGRKARHVNGTRRQEEYRRYYLPEQLRAARRKVEMLEREAERRGIVV